MNPEQKQVIVSCHGADVAPLSAFQIIQGELKSLPPAHYEALKDEIITEGFSFPLNIWEDEQGKLNLLDGTQRVIVLTRMKEEGWEIPLLPFCFVDASSLEHAKTKLLAAASQYGVTNEFGLVKFLQDVKIDPIKLASNFPLPKINMPKFIETHFPAHKDTNDIGSAPVSIPGSTVPTETAVPTSNVRMVQIFLDDSNFAEFMDKITQLQGHLGKENLTDTVLEVVRAYHQSEFPN